MTSDGPVVITIPTARCIPPVVEQLKDVLATHPGVTHVHLQLQRPAAPRCCGSTTSLRVTPSPALFGDLKALLGPSCLQ